jgi:integrase
LNRAYAKLATEAHVRRISSHGARHTSGSSFAMMGVGQAMIAQLLGHSDPGTTRRYTHVRNDATQALVEARWEKLGG